MNIQVNTDNHIKAKGTLIADVETEIRAALERFAGQITRIEVHIADVNGPKTVGDDKRCLLEARLAGRQPMAVSQDARTIEEAVEGAVDKLKRSLDSTLGRLHDPKGRTSFGGDQTI